MTPYGKSLDDRLWEDLVSPICLHLGMPLHSDPKSPSNRLRIRLATLQAGQQNQVMTEYGAADTGREILNSLEKAPIELERPF